MSISVTQLSDKIKNILSDKFPVPIKIKAEIATVKNSGNNVYMTLKDENSSINAVSFQNKFNVANGDNIIASGKISTYPRQGIYQLIVSSVEKIGVGDISTKYEELKKSCEKNGLFAKKRSLPKEINRIGILTSVEGAALQDILYVLNNNSFTGEIYVKNCSVQGSLCPKSICEGIKYFNNFETKVDIILITRGGGSLEDLIGYSSKEVIHAIFDSKIITISAVGHEVDFMLSDFTADVRAPTPSISAEMISSIQKNYRNKCIENLSKLKTLIINRLNNYDDKFEHLKKTIQTYNPNNIIENELLNLEKLRLNFRHNLELQIKNYETRISSLKAKNNSNNMRKILNKGYTVISDNGNIISNVDTLKKCIDKKQKLKIIMSDGELELSNISYVHR